MKKLIIRIIAAVMILAIVLSLAVIAFATESNSFNAGVTITEQEDGSISVLVNSDDETNAILAQETPTLTVACSFESAYVLYNGAVVDSSLANGKIAFTVAQGGEYLIVEGEPPVQNVAKIGDTEYASLEEALAAAQPNDTVKLSTDVDGGTYLVVPVDVDIDLNGYTLTADYVAAFDGANVIDNTGAGLLKVAQNKIILSKNNSMVPVWNTVEGYIFTNYAIVDSAQAMGFVVNEEEDVATLTFVTFFQNAGLLTNGGNDNGLTVNVRMSWTVLNDNGSVNGQATQDFVFSNEQMATVVAANGSKAFQLNLANYSTLTNLTLQAMVVSEAGAEFAGTKYPTDT